MLSVEIFRYPLLVTIAYAVLYYLTTVNVALVKGKLFREYQAKGEKFDRYRTPDARMLAADRIQLNMLEQMPVFLVLFWLTAVFASPLRAAGYGAAYLASRIVYPLMMGTQLGRNIPKRILFATVTGYLVIAAFVIELALVTLLR
ncbi:MAG: MAPEG family protein [Myxococcota bacterium]